MEESKAWVGSFGLGAASYRAVLPLMYMALAVPPANLLVTDNGVWLEAWDESGLRWRSRRISSDGMRDLRIENGEVKGEAWSAPDDCEYPFAVDLATGIVEGGSYDGPPDWFATT